MYMNNSEDGISEQGLFFHVLECGIRIQDFKNIF